MTLRELINSVDSEQYSDSALYQKLRETKPEYGANRRIQVKPAVVSVVLGEVTAKDAGHHLALVVHHLEGVWGAIPAIADDISDMSMPNSLARPSPLCSSPQTG